MKGVQAVQIDLEKQGRLWEDFYGRALAKQRASEPRESLEKREEQGSGSVPAPPAGLAREGRMKIRYVPTLRPGVLSVAALLVGPGRAQKLTPQQEHAYNAVETCAKEQRFGYQF